MPDKSVYLYQEARANFFNMLLMLVMAFLGGIALIFNEVGIFTADKNMFREAILQLATYALIPFLIYVKFAKSITFFAIEFVLSMFTSFFRVTMILFSFVGNKNLIIFFGLSSNDTGKSNI